MIDGLNDGRSSWAEDKTRWRQWKTAVRQWLFLCPIPSMGKKWGIGELLKSVDRQHYDCRWETATLFSLLFGGLCYFGSQRIIGAVNGGLVVGIIAPFTALVVVASGDLHWDALLRTNLEAAPRKCSASSLYESQKATYLKTAIVLGTTIPLALFLVWNAVILRTNTTPKILSNTIIDPLQQLRSSNGVIGPIVDVFSVLAIATSYIRFVLGLSDFLTDCMEIRDVDGGSRWR